MRLKWGLLLMEDCKPQDNRMFAAGFGQLKLAANKKRRPTVRPTKSASIAKLPNHGDA
jgi:hypothetical protein